MVVEIKDLREGDEILVSANSGLKYLRLLRDPQIGKRLHWYTKAPLYKTVKCSTRKDDIHYTSGTRTYTKRKFICTPEDHNIEIYQNLENRTIWLIKRKNQ